jgi:hypothetical protein
MMFRLRAILLVAAAVGLFVAPAMAQDQKFALRFGFIIVEPTGDSFDDTQGGFEVDFEWYFHPRVGFEVASLGSLSSEFEGEGDYVTGMAFSTFTVGINGHVVRSKKVDFALGLLAGGATYRDIKVAGETATIEAKRDTTFGAQAFVDMTVSHKWAVSLGLKYVDTQVEFERGTSLDFSPVILSVMGVYRWGKHK